MAAANLPDDRPLWADLAAPAAGGAERATEPRASVESASPDLRSLFEQNYASVWRLLKRFGVVSSQLDDAAQEVFWVAARKLADIRPEKERSFLYGVALRVASNELRRRRTAPPLAAAEELAELVDSGPGPDEQLEQRRARQLLDAVLDRLPHDLRAVFVLAELEGLELREIAELEQIPLGTASSRLRRAREEFNAIARRLRAAFAAREGRHR